MACPIHHFLPVNGCPLCNSLVGGFLSGFSGAPLQWYGGLDRIIKQRGFILPQKGRPEEEETRLLGRELHGAGGQVASPALGSIRLGEHADYRMA